MELSFLPNWPTEINTTLRIALALLIAAISGELSVKYLRLPRISGYAISGILLGPSLFGWFNANDFKTYRVIIELALALLLFELGIRVDIRWIRKNPWILASSLAEASLTFAGSFSILLFLGIDIKIAAAVAAIAIGTSPAIVMRVASELMAQGQVTQRLFVHTTLNVIYSVVLSKILIGGMHSSIGNDLASAILHPIYLISGSILMGVVIALFFKYFRGILSVSENAGVAILFGLLLLSVAMMQILAIPAFLAPLLAGIMVKLTDTRPQGWTRHFGPAGGIFVMLLFVLTGTTITSDAIIAGGFTALALILVRLFTKIAGTVMFGSVSGISMRQSLALGVALLPMSGTAFLLSEDIRNIYPEFGDKVGAIVLSMVVILEILGPLAVQWTLRSSKETYEGDK